MAIQDIQSLQQHLQWAIELEHATLPPYLCALYSIKEGHNRDAVEVIESVFLEEMLHMMLAANVLNAIGGAPKIDKPGFIASYPAYLPHSDEAFLVPLMKFSPEALETFLRIERPEEHAGLPEDDKYETIGQFYAAIEEALIRLCDTLGEAAVFCGNPQRQVRPEALPYGGSGRVIAVEDLASALKALGEIVEQGEGLQHEEVWDGDRNMFHPERGEVAHYFRYLELKTGRRFQTGDTPQGGPTGASFTVDWDGVYNMRPNPAAADYAAGSAIRVKLDGFNRAYSSLLRMLQRAFNGQPRLLAQAVGAMYEIRHRAVDLMQTPSGDGATTVGPSFEYLPAEGVGDMRITVRHNGPYFVQGRVRLVRKTPVYTEYGEPISWQKVSEYETDESYELCRCGGSRHKPFCDGTHARKGFDGTERADTHLIAEGSDLIPGTNMVLKDDHSFCAHAGFCGFRDVKLRQLMARTADTKVRALAMGMVDHCPSGTYRYALNEDGPDNEVDLPVQIAVTVDGPLWVTGGVQIERSDGQPVEVRNRVTLCRCGHSQNKPFCDGTHEEIGFKG